MFLEWSDYDIVDMMIAIASDNFNGKYLRTRPNSRYVALEDELRRRHADDWDDFMRGGSGYVHV